jgi:hypothetical protein
LNLAEEKPDEVLMDLGTLDREVATCQPILSRIAAI